MCSKFNWNRFNRSWDTLSITDIFYALIFFLRIGVKFSYYLYTCIILHSSIYVGPNTKYDLNSNGCSTWTWYWLPSQNPSCHKVSIQRHNICSLDFIIVSLIPLTSGQLVISALKGLYLCIWTIHIWQGAWASSLDNYWLLILMIPLIKLPAASWRVFLVRRIWTVDKCKERFSKLPKSIIVNVASLSYDLY